MTTTRGPDFGKLLISGLLCLLGPAMNAATDPYLLLSAQPFTDDQLQFTLQAESGVSYVIETSSDCQNWSPVATNSDFELTRLITLSAATNETFVRVWRQPLPIFANALVTKLNISLQGNDVHFDSFDSADPAYSTNGEYDPNKAKAGGDLASGYGLITVGNAKINGRIKTGPAGSYSLGPNGCVGPIGWTFLGVVAPGWYQNNFRFANVDVSPPFTNGLPPVGAGTNFWLLGNADYFVDGNIQLPSNTNILVAGHARLYVTGEFMMQDTSPIIIAPGAALKLFSGGTRTTLCQIRVADGAAAFQYYGLSSVTNVTWSGNSNFVGTVYAPQSSFRLSGGGSTVYHFFGACVVREAAVNGHIGFHFDENLKRIGPMR
jgi:hypothetical protein